MRSKLARTLVGCLAIAFLFLPVACTSTGPDIEVARISFASSTTGTVDDRRDKYPELGPIDFLSESFGYLVVDPPCKGCPRRLLVTRDRARTWTLVKSGNLPDGLSFVSPSVGFGVHVSVCPRGVCGQRIVRTTDGGRTWETVSPFDFPPPFKGGAGLDFVSPSDGWVIAGDQILRTQNGGEDWTGLALRCPEESGFVTVDFADSSNGHAACAGEFATIDMFKTFFTTEDGGASWTRGFSGFSNGHNPQLEFLTRDLGFMAQGRTGVARTTDGGESWKTILSEETPYGMSWLTPSSGYVIVQSVLKRTTDGGATWRQVHPRLERNPWGPVSFVSPDEGVGAWFPGGGVMRHEVIARTTDGGETWRRIGTTVPRFTRVELLMHVTPDLIWAEVAGGRPYVFSLIRSEDGGRTWEVMRRLGRTPATLSFPTPDVGFYAVRKRLNSPTGGERLYSTTDGGETWRLVNESRTLWGIDFVSPSEGWAVGQRGLLLHTEDAGESWAEMKLPVLELAGWDFVDATHGWAEVRVCKRPRNETSEQDCKRTQTLLLSTSDGGLSWEVVRFPSGFALGELQFVDRNVGFGRTLDTDLYRTTDGGRTWQRVF